MTNSVEFTGRPFHFIGVGGIGMSALAQIVAERNLPVSGSDLSKTTITDRLEKAGVKLFYSQDAGNFDHYKLAGTLSEYSSETFAESQSIGSASSTATLVQSLSDTHIDQGYASQLPQVVCSTAIHPDNAEYCEAKRLGCPIFHRSDVLAGLIREYQSIAVAGTHGKTTTSGMIAYVLEQAGVDPTVVIGGEVAALGGNARSGQGSYLVAEADESDGSLVKFQSYVGVITNLELDHLDHYKNLEQLVETLQTFAGNCQAVVGCIDCENVRTHLPLTLSYSLDPSRGADYTVDQVEYSGDGTTARVWERGQILGQLTVRLLGTHNLSNALAAIAVGRHIGLSFEAIIPAIATYEGARRRFDYRGDAQGIVFVDDYAHHPSEILVTLQAAKLQVSSGKTRLPIVPTRIVAIFQPHRYSRTRALLQEFASCFGDADVVVLCEVYSAGERDSTGASGEALAAAVRQHHGNVHYCPSLDAVSAWAKAHLQAGDLALFLGAGNLNRTIPGLVEHFQTGA
jgi:UDP-N-acetylmuramate--alanine ligase